MARQPCTACPFLLDRANVMLNAAVTTLPLASTRFSSLNALTCNAVSCEAGTQQNARFLRLEVCSVRYSVDVTDDSPCQT